LPLKKVLIANRGEIAIRIARGARELGIASATVFTEPDRGSLHVGYADEAVSLGEEPRAYLDIERIVSAAREAGADSVHPGYGFLSENADFAEAVERAGLIFVGPPKQAIRAMGSKLSARALMASAGVPVVPGGAADSLDEVRASARSVGYPVLVKASEGGGGKGMRRVDHEADLAAAFERTRSEAEAAFGVARVYIEKALIRPRHVELQILGDREGTLVHLYERDCSIQRRHQKIVEETPCPVLPSDVLERMIEVALVGARSIGYYSAGTFEFLLDANAFYFLEMNTRLQVEHPITELVTGIDLVHEMFRIAAGEKIPENPPPRSGAAIEVRLYAEQPSLGFLPSPGRIELLREPGGPGVRVDSGVEEGSGVGREYDPLLAKLSVWGTDRERALSRLRRALGEYSLLGVETNLEFLGRLVRDPEYVRGEYDTEFVNRRQDLAAPLPLSREEREEWLSALAVLDLSEPSRVPERNTREGLPAWVLAERSRLR
jgi:acetyl-CoA carboxylase biotin carboxylase subunit